MVSQLEARAKGAKGRSTRTNLSGGHSRGAELGNPTKFMWDWLVSLDPNEDISACLIVERAHWAPMASPPVGTAPRPFIMRVLNYAGAILSAARWGATP
ncbi:hypothetical protein NDU88_007903 [Pleurodeles waltl]|uniref:Uncharacterized protein n=1 Tax=Pleurodeles waltl TaxID=8319 RepID=A0AAV7VV45_PLEWA|nr:hypothetical protein NDU88_007903 [Pleurodeles waltl]